MLMSPIIVAPTATGTAANTREQKRIAEDVLRDILGDDDPRSRNPKEMDALLGRIRDGRVGDLLEFSRAVHAEMDALLSAGRKGANTLGTRLFVTTFPCHYCARHIVSAGVDEVQFIEPYPKSQALTLHRDSIRYEKGDKPWVPPSQKDRSKRDSDSSRVLFRPFTGVAPQITGGRSRRIASSKTKTTGTLSIHQPDWSTPYDLSRMSYAELEAALTKDMSA